MTATIEPQFYDLQWPGSNDYPGHRDIQAESHVGGADTVDGIPTIYFNFIDKYGTDPFGNVLHNLITEDQKQRPARNLRDVLGNRGRAVCRNARVHSERHEFYDCDRRPSH